MKRFILPIVAAYMLLTGTACLLDLILVVSGCVNHVSYPNLGITVITSPIIHYDVSIATNLLIGFIAGIAFFVGSFLILVNRTPKSKVHVWQKPRATKQVDKWLKDQLN